MSISDERLAETVARLQKIIDYFDAEANEALAGQTERGDLWSDIEIPVADLRVLMSVASQLHAAAPSGDEVEAAAQAWSNSTGNTLHAIIKDALSAAAKVRAGREGRAVNDLVRAANALLNTLWQKVYTGGKSFDANWQELERQYPQARWLQDAVKALSTQEGK